MPSMPRIPGLAKKIAYKILGTPSNMLKDRKGKMDWEEINRRLLYEETARVR